MLQQGIDAAYVKHVDLIDAGSMATFLSALLPREVFDAADITADRIAELAIKVGVDQLLSQGDTGGVQNVWLLWRVVTPQLRLRARVCEQESARGSGHQTSSGRRPLFPFLSSLTLLSKICPRAADSKTVRNRGQVFGSQSEAGLMETFFGLFGLSR